MQEQDGRFLLHPIPVTSWAAAISMAAVARCVLWISLQSEMVHWSPRDTPLESSFESARMPSFGGIRSCTLLNDGVGPVKNGAGISLAALVLIGGVSCGTVDGDGPSRAGADSCGSEAWRSYVGQRVDALNDVELPEATRVLFPGSVATTDFLPERLNIAIGTDDLVEQVYCG